MIMIYTQKGKCIYHNQLVSTHGMYNIALHEQNNEAILVLLAEVYKVKPILYKIQLNKTSRDRDFCYCNFLLNLRESL